MILSALFLTIQHFPALLQTSLIGHTAHLGFLAVHTARPVCHKLMAHSKLIIGRYNFFKSISTFVGSSFVVRPIRFAIRLQCVSTTTAAYRIYRQVQGLPFFCPFRQDLSSPPLYRVLPRRKRQ